jgi:hypothetical protein
MSTSPSTLKTTTHGVNRPTPTDLRVVNLRELRKSKDASGADRDTSASFLAEEGDTFLIGHDYVPPLVAGLETTVPPKVHDTVAMFAEIGAPPDSFDWRNKSDVCIKRFGMDEVGGVVASLFKPPNQLRCGSCWAWAAATAFSDRLTIFSASTNPQLSPSFMMSCDTAAASDGSSNLACAGGFLDLAALFLEETGLPRGGCWPHTWCDKNPFCNGTGGDASVEALNAIVPPCSAANSAACLTCSSTGCVPRTPPPAMVLHKAKAGSTLSLTTPEALQLEVWENGPVPVPYVVFNDMIGRASSESFSEGWQNTGGIYVNLPTGLYDYSSVVTAGNHAVVVVGWGVDTNPQGLSASTTATLKAQGGLRYWILRNSWGAQWNGDGYWKCAWSYPDLDINVAIVMDYVTQSSGGWAIGGGTSFMPKPSPATVINELLGSIRISNGSKRRLGSIKQVGSKTRLGARGVRPIVSPTGEDDDDVVVDNSTDDIVVLTAPMAPLEREAAGAFDESDGATDGGGNVPSSEGSGETAKVAGIVAGVVVGALLLTALVWYLVKKRSRTTASLTSYTSTYTPLTF